MSSDLRVIKSLILAALLGAATAASAVTVANVAPLGTASQSSVWNGSYNGGDYNYSAAASAALALDGNTNGYWYAGNTFTLNHTDSEAGAWWQVQLPQNYAVQSIVIWNRTDTPPEGPGRITPFSVALYDGATQQWVAGNNTFSANLGDNGNNQGMSFDVSGATGNLVRVWLNGTNYLHMAEVQVFATAVPEPASVAMFMLGLGVVAGVVRRGSKAKREGAQ